MSEWIAMYAPIPDAHFQQVGCRGISVEQGRERDKRQTALIHSDWPSRVSANEDIPILIVFEGWGHLGSRNFDFSQLDVCKARVPYHLTKSPGKSQRIVSEGNLIVLYVRAKYTPREVSLHRYFIYVSWVILRLTSEHRYVMKDPERPVPLHFQGLDSFDRRRLGAEVSFECCRGFAFRLRGGKELGLVLA